MKKRLLLVNPTNHSKPLSMPYSGDSQDTSNTSNIIKRTVGKRTVGIMNAALATIAALTPEDAFEIEIIDEQVDTLDFNKPYDIVGITAILTQFLRATEISAEFQRRGITVVCGGSSVSLSPERWRAHADVLIIGEAERTWPRFTADYLTGNYEKEYRETERFDLTCSPIPDYRHYSEEARHQIAGIVQTSRGCPFNCEFCDVINYVGRKMRYKPLENIMQEVEQLADMGFPVIGLADDNFSASRSKAKTILKSLRDWNRKRRSPVAFMTQLSIDTAQDEEFLRLATEAGLGRVLIGIESPNPDSLRETNKLQNIRHSMFEELKKFQQFGIQVLGTTIVGFDNDDLSIFKQHLDFHEGSGVLNIHVYPLQAPDGSALRQRAIREGRYRDWETNVQGDPRKANMYNTFTLIPKQMTMDQLKQGRLWLLHNLYSPERFLQRFTTFLTNFESSPYRANLTFPKHRLNVQILRGLGKFIPYFLFKTTPEEKRLIKEMWQQVRASHFPNRFPMLLMGFISFKTMRETIRAEEPNIDSLEYPKAMQKETA
jgi:radical SAM superfamily enzyme YgiQ (UPF0313 family)